MSVPVQDNATSAPIWVVLVAGGRSLRFGTDKLSMLLDKTIAGLPTDWPIVVVGPQRATVRKVSWIREDPPLSGPLAAIGAGVAQVPAAASHVVVVAADMPQAGLAVAALVQACGPTVDVAYLVDREGIRQPLLACYRAAWLRATLARHVPLDNRPARLLLANGQVVEVADRWGAGHDVDTPTDLI
jgi:molybdopterin-guanine dinucleotide biosynthesis protein A